jgi:hypothetical protein
MNRSARPAIWPALLTLAAIVLTPSPCAAQESRREFLQGTHAFRYLLQKRGCTPLRDFNDLAKEPTKNILIVFGDTSVLEDNRKAIKGLVSNGVALLVATDHRVQPRRGISTTWAGDFGVAFLGQPVLAPEKSSYRQQFAECPIIVPIQGSNPNLFEKLEHSVVANRAGLLLRSFHLGRDLPALATYPSGSEYRGRPLDLSQCFFAVGGDWGEKGRVLLLADHSVFINNMMLQFDTGNAEFAYNCLDWLRGMEGRDRVLFYDEGKIVRDFNVPVTFPPLNMPPDLMDLVNQAIVGLERENMHNKLLEQYVGYKQIEKWIAIALTSLLATYLFLRLLWSRFQLDTAAPLLAPLLARLAPVRAGIVQRHSSLLAEGNLWEPARALARDFFETALRTAEPPHGPEPPPFQSSESWLARRFLERLVRHLWQLAYGLTPERIAPAAFAHLAAQVDELKAALADGSLRFQTTGTL